MNVNQLILTSNPFIEAYLLSDTLGKLIFICLILLSICSWIILIYKIWIISMARRNSGQFQKDFESQKNSPLTVNCNLPSGQKEHNSFLSLYTVFRKQSIEMLNKNRLFGTSSDKSQDFSHLSATDIDVIESQLTSTIATQTKHLESHLYILSTIVSLAPFLGLLGTVWGILTTFSELQVHNGGGAHQMVLGGLSMALATTVLGLLDAIPALIGYNYLKNTISNFETEMSSFAMEILTTIEMQYRKVDVRYSSHGYSFLAEQNTGSYNENLSTDLPEEHSPSDETLQPDKKRSTSPRGV